MLYYTVFSILPFCESLNKEGGSWQNLWKMSVLLYNTNRLMLNLSYRLQINQYINSAERADTRGNTAWG